MAEIEKTSWIYCNACKGRTRHVLVISKEYNTAARCDEGEPAEWGEYRLWSCAGCDTCVMEDYYSADYMVSFARSGANEDNQIYESLYHPKRASSTRPNKHFVNLPEKLSTLYSEVIKSNNEGLHLLCAAGLRSLLEGLCADKNLRGSSLQKKIEEMKTLLPESIVTNLHEFRFMGNMAVHELEAPKEYELSAALDVIEDILNYLYALDYKANLLAQMRAARRMAAPAISATSPPITPAQPAPEVLAAEPLKDKLNS